MRPRPERRIDEAWRTPPQRQISFDAPSWRKSGGGNGGISDYDAVGGAEDLTTCQDGCLRKSDVLQYGCVRFIRAIPDDNTQGRMARLQESGRQTRDAVRGLEAWRAQNYKAWLVVPKARDDYEDDESAAICTAAVRAAC